MQITNTSDFILSSAFLVEVMFGGGAKNNPVWTDLEPDLSKLTLDEQAIIKRVMVKDAIVNNNECFSSKAAEKASSCHPSPEGVGLDELIRLSNAEASQIRHVMQRDEEFQREIQIR